ncbi:SNF2 family N-terminal domain-containing protein [Polychytrium aggregatum]|uniref:SNF2 family N-terminal domain-containing protein n=1 Tax=Polychytrium aggregatum TaxID=110093 RepID=UPI0022FE27E9|nr:SNF2 family N-terminal domain-containing protein [Polychytrium aggregatum]KAI9203510.1 SNF2 family N-terminal domain-containing protein [Polychytrium aggregatum]
MASSLDHFKYSGPKYNPASLKKSFSSSSISSSSSSVLLSPVADHRDLDHDPELDLECSTFVPETPKKSQSPATRILVMESPPAQAASKSYIRPFDISSSPVDQPVRPALSSSGSASSQDSFAINLPPSPLKSKSASFGSAGVSTSLTRHSLALPTPRSKSESFSQNHTAQSKPGVSSNRNSHIKPIPVSESIAQQFGAFAFRPKGEFSPTSSPASSPPPISKYQPLKSGTGQPQTAFSGWLNKSVGSTKPAPPKPATTWVSRIVKKPTSKRTISTSDEEESSSDIDDMSLTSVDSAVSKPDPKSDITTAGRRHSSISTESHEPPSRSMTKKPKISAGLEDLITETRPTGKLIRTLEKHEQKPPMKAHVDESNGTRRRRLVQKQTTYHESSTEVEDDIELVEYRVKPRPDTTQSAKALAEETDEIQVVNYTSRPVRHTEERRKPIAISSDDEDDWDASNGMADDYEDEDTAVNQQHRQVVYFFNTAELQQLMDVTSCTQEQGKLIVDSRPYRNYEHLEEVISQTSKRKGLSTILKKYEEVMESYFHVDQLIEKCEKIGRQLKGVLTDMNGSGASDEYNPSLDPRAFQKVSSSHGGAESITVQPKIVNKALALKPYQLVGISWLNLLYRKGYGGILADEMGLGKTAQIISFLGLLYEQGHEGPHLVVVPSSTKDNWLREFKKWCPSLVVQSYYGSQAERFELQESLLETRGEYQVLVTTYNLATGNKEDRGFLKRMKFRSLILDEGHMVKNMDSSRTRHLMSYKIPFRMLLTGTPLQNNLKELLSLLTFVMPALFSDWVTEGSTIKKLFNITDHNNVSFLSHQRIERAQKIMSPFVLRRKKDQVLRDLPKKIQIIEHCKATERQRALIKSIMVESRKTYRENISLSQKDTNGKAAKGTNTSQANQRKQLQNFTLMQTATIYEDMQVMSDYELHQLCLKFPTIFHRRLQSEEWMSSGKIEVLQKMLPSMIAAGDRILIFSQFIMMLDILEAVMQTLGISYRRMDGSTAVNDRQDIIDEFNDNDDIPVMLLSTKAGGFGINLTSANVVILHDLDFNPHNDAQAEDRAHRVGQTREVRVIKFVVEESIEEGILKCAQAKLKLDRKIQGHDDEADAAATTMADEPEGEGKGRAKGRGQKGKKTAGTQGADANDQDSAMDEDDEFAIMAMLREDLERE